MGRHRRSPPPRARRAPRWIPKWWRDRRRGVDAPLPTQVVSNEEFLPRPQTQAQRRVERLLAELADDRARRLGVDRREFLRSGMGLAAAFLASNLVYGPAWDVEAAETLDADALREKRPEGEFFVFDVQTHFTDGRALGFRSMRFLRELGLRLEDDVDAYGFANYVREVFLDSETDVAMISGIPGQERQRRRDGTPYEGKDRRGGILPSWLMARRRNEINQLAGTRRALCQGNCAPNHYWNRSSDSPDRVALAEQIEREVALYGIDSWKWYCHVDPANRRNGFRLDDEALTYPFYERARALGRTIFCVHKGFPFQNRRLAKLAHPADVERAALDNPDLRFVVYHSALLHGPDERPRFDADTGDFAWHADLMRIRQRNPTLRNVYCELGSAFGTLAVVNPEMCMHLVGRCVKTFGADRVLWGTDSLWWGSPQWQIDAFRRFGYAKLTREDRAKILGGNAARLYGIDAAAARAAHSADSLRRLREVYRARGGRRENAAHGWVRADA